MAKRETYEQKITCPKCNLTGIAEFEENETPPHHNGKLNTEVTSLSKGFKKGNGEGEILCGSCGVVVAR